MRCCLPLRRRSLGCLCFLAAYLVSPRAGAAQWQVDAIVGHTFTSYLVSGLSPIGSDAVTYQQRDNVPPFAIGGRVTRQFPSRWGVEFGLTADQADLLVTIAGSGAMLTERRSGRVIYADAKGIRQLGKAGSRWGFQVGAGPTVSWRTGEAYENTSGTWNFGLAIGAGARLRLRGISFRLDLEDRLYRLGLTAAGLPFPRKTMNDVLLSLGVGLYTSGVERRPE